MAFVKGKVIKNWFIVTIAKKPMCIYWMSVKSLADLQLGYN